MAQQLQHNGTQTIGFKSVQLLKTQTLGIGSYGSVCKALCDDLLCAAKIIHPTLFDPNAHQQIERQREHRLPFSRFMKECEFMSAIKHPNIVQYLGTTQDPQTGLPVLLMELMDDSLTHFLDSSQEAVPYHIQVNFCHDIAKAISYLHSNRITHRDLSSNNVLLCGNVKAKVTDFGMAKLSDTNPQATRISFTLCPGTDAYMPPEAVKDNPVYTEKIDCFAIGTLIIQILTRCFPQPGNRHKTMQIDHPSLPGGGTVDVRIPEIERRQNHIGQVDPDHPLLPVALSCLKDTDVERPTAQELCSTVAALKETPLFTESVRGIHEGLEPHQTVGGEGQDQNADDIIQEKDDIIQQRDDVIREKNDVIQEKDDIIQQRDDVIREKNDAIHQRDDVIRDKDDIIQQRDDVILEKNDIIREKDDIIQEKDDAIRTRNELIAVTEQKLNDTTKELQQQVRDKEEESLRERQEYAQQMQKDQQFIETQTKRLQELSLLICEKHQNLFTAQQECQQLWETISDKDHVITEKDSIIHEKEEAIVSSQRELKQLKEVKDQIITKKDAVIREREQTIEASQVECKLMKETYTTQLEEKDRQLQRVIEQLESSQKLTAQYKAQVEQLEQQNLKQISPQAEDLVSLLPEIREPPNTHHPDICQTTTRVNRDTVSFTLRWRDAEAAPCKMYRGSDAVVDGNMVYFRAAPTRNIFTYNSTDKTWNQLPECEARVCSLAIVNGLLTTIGGRMNGGKVTNQLFSFVEEDGGTKRWRKMFQSMPTRRSASVAACTGQILIVTGGLSQEGKTLRTVEVMDLATQEWKLASPLPEPLSQASVTVHHDRIYFVGGFVDGKATKSVYTCTLANLLQSGQSRERSLSLTRRTRSRSTVWNKVADLPVIGFTCITLHGRLLTFGGSDPSTNVTTSDVCVYHPATNTWEVISKMNVSRFCCFVAVLPNSEVMVVGGLTTSSMFSKTNSVEIATVEV